MKSIYLIVLALVLVASCSENEEFKSTPLLSNNKITFIANIDNPEQEVVIKKMIRYSVMEEVYAVLKNNDTISFDAIGRSYFKIGQRTKILQNVICDQNDTISITLNKDSIHFNTRNSDIDANKAWLALYKYEVEDALKLTFQPIINNSVNLDFLSEPVYFYNDYETLESLYTHIYNIDRTAYEQNKIQIDDNLRALYLQLDSIINSSNLDIGSKRIMHSSLFELIRDKLQRLDSSEYNWMIDIINQKYNEDCSKIVDTNTAEFYIIYSSGKKIQNISHLDIRKVFQNLHKINCPELRKELKRVCLQMLFDNGNKLIDTKELLDDYVLEYKDSTFYTMITEKYSINDSFLKKGDKSSFLSNIENKQFEYENVILEHKGNIILVDFWASWCGPCRKGMPKIKELEKKYSDANLKVIYISIDQYPNRWKTASKEEKIWNRNNYWAYNFNESEIYKRFKITHIPRYLIYDKKGEIAFQKGSKSDNLEDIIIDLLNTSE